MYYCQRARRTGSVKWRRSRSRRDAVGALDRFRETSTIPGGGSGSVLLPEPRALVFTGPQGAQLRRSNFARAWSRATAAAGLPGFHFHDLRHTGNTLAGEAGATLRELMDRMGHASTRAALIYQHRTTHRDRLIADEISKRAQAALKPSGTQRARGKKKRS